MAPSIGDQGLGGDGLYPDGERPGPDPVIGAGIALLGIFLMGTGGARDAHYVFDVGVGTAVLGAATFVVCVALSALKQRRAARLSVPATPEVDDQAEE